jgi:DNA invertase Pin-like site-specific DNA recombinase
VKKFDLIGSTIEMRPATLFRSQTRDIIWSLHENFDTITASGRLIFEIFEFLGQFEVELLRERTKIALKARCAGGRIGGYPPALDKVKFTAAKAAPASGELTAAGVAR